MTEQEAKTKWCPFAQEAIPIQSNMGGMAFIVGNRATGAPELSRCIASACMMWRWEATEHTSLPPGEEPSGEGWVKGALWKDGRFQRWARQNHSGHCGRAGKP